MGASRKTSPDAATLARLIRHSPALDAAARRRWLAVLPHLTPDDCERLRELLMESPEPLREGEEKSGEP